MLTKPPPPSSFGEETLFPTVTKDPLCLKEEGEPRVTPLHGSVPHALGLGGASLRPGVHNRAPPPPGSQLPDTPSTWDTKQGKVAGT